MDAHSGSGDVTATTQDAPKVVGRKSAYHAIIALSLARQHLGPVEPRLIEGWMRVQHSTLDGLDRASFDREVALGAACVNADPNGSEVLAQSYGL
jgi:hypothetical protein